MPKSLGGKGDGQNPEMLFAMGYACKHHDQIISTLDVCLLMYHTACMLASIQLASSKLNKVSEAKDAVVHTRVHLGKPSGHDGYGQIGRAHV